jgi:hypothetical protein
MPKSRVLIPSTTLVLVEWLLNSTARQTPCLIHLLKRVSLQVNVVSPKQLPQFRWSTMDMDGSFQQLKLLQLNALDVKMAFMLWDIVLKITCTALPDILLN